MDAKIFEYIVESMPMPVLYCDMDHVIRYLNREAKRYYYVTRPFPEMVGKNHEECHKPETWLRILNLYEKMKNDGFGEERVGTSEIEGYRIYMTPVRDDDGALVGYLQRFEDGAHR